MSLRWSDERAKKGKVNPHFKNKYADLGEIWDACSDALAANDIAIIQSPGEFLNGAVGMDSLLLHSSGEWVCGSLSIPIGNKVDAQAYGSATTYARRYALAAMLGIIQEDDDGNAASRPAPKRDEARKAEPIPASVQMMLEKIGEAETAMALKRISKPFRLSIARWFWRPRTTASSPSMRWRWSTHEPPGRTGRD
jgi:hypothetical protein